MSLDPTYVCKAFEDTIKYFQENYERNIETITIPDNIFRILNENNLLTDIIKPGVSYNILDGNYKRIKIMTHIPNNEQYVYIYSKHKTVKFELLTYDQHIIKSII